MHNLSIEAGAYPSPLNYHGFPKSVCTSVNNVAVHGIPDLRPLEGGDIVNVDITVSLYMFVNFRRTSSQGSERFHADILPRRVQTLKGDCE